MSSHIRLGTHIFGVNGDMQRTVNMTLLHGHEKSYLGTMIAQFVW